jgi:uncharacterized membrane protein YukC
MLYTIISILSVLVVALSFAIYNILQKLEKYEDIIEENDKFLNQSWKETKHYWRHYEKLILVKCLRRMMK